MPSAELAIRDLPALRRRLLLWYRRNKRDLDWRRTRDPYHIWISEVMLQQTRVAVVTDYYRRWVKRFPTVHHLARAPLDTVLRQWAGLGYYSRARNLHRAAQEIAARHKGEFPRSLEDALELPGIGSYTANAVLSIAYDTPLAVVDGNVARVIARLLALRPYKKADLRAAPTWQRISAVADALLERRAPGDWNQAVMELGATVCNPRSPRCGECPVARWCRAHALGLADRIPAPRRKPAPQRLTLAAAVLLDPRGRVLLLKQQDASSEIFSRLWQFPAIAPRHRDAGVAKSNGDGAPAPLPPYQMRGNTEKNDHASDSAARALSLHLERAFGLAEAQAQIEPLTAARHTVTFRNIRLLPFLARVAQLPPVRESLTPRLRDVTRLSVSSATRKIADAALAALSGRR